MSKMKRKRREGEGREGKGRGGKGRGGKGREGEGREGCVYRPPGFVICEVRLGGWGR